MSQGPSNYMDDVPIVVSEKWKIPPLPNIPEFCVAGFYDTTDKLEQQLFKYDYSLEKKILEKVEEWKIARSREIDEREHRIKLRQEEKRKRLEAEGTKLKEQLTQVSYPSPDEFSSSDDEETTNPKAAISEQKNVDNQPFNSFNSILTPTVVNRAHLSNEITSSDLEALSNVTMSRTSGTNVWNYNRNTSKLELADFENDASDPFYSMELKTIDDLDILAQVLKTSNTLHSKVKQNSCNKNVNNNNNNNDSSREEDKESVSDNKSKDEEEGKQQGTDPDQAESQPTTQINGPYTIEPYAAALPQYSDSGFSSSTYAPPHVYSNYNQSQFYTGTNYYGTGNVYMPPSTFNAITSPYTTESLSPSFIANKNENMSIVSDTASTNLRSKSVPDIVKELEDELKDSQQRRIRNNSQCQEEQRKRQSNKPTLNDSENTSSNIKTKQQNCDDQILNKLPKELQNLALKISQMGFPLDRVCRIAEQVNGDDKKIIEHLIPLTELLDLGFEEKNISDALLKFDNNKEKALDFLIS